MLGAMKPTLLHRRHTTGLTIVELLTVVVVLGVLLTVVAPSFRGAMQRHRVQGVHDQLITDLQLARSELTVRASASTATPIAVTFGSDANLTCYTIHTTGVAGVTCDCTRAPGQACQPPNLLQEIRTVQVRRVDGVTLAASSASGPSVMFSPPQGTATPTDLVIAVVGEGSGQLRTQVREFGRADVCSPDGSIAGVPRCP